MITNRNINKKILAKSISDNTWIHINIVHKVLTSFHEEIEYNLTQWNKVKINWLFSLITKKAKPLTYNRKLKTFVKTKRQRWLRCIFSNTLIENITLYDKHN
jgi:nucleoid DNA-binding protein